MIPPSTHPAERETPAGEAMREAVAFVEDVLRKELIVRRDYDSVMRAADWIDGTEVAASAIASKLARLTAERDEAREDHVRAEAHICALEVLAHIDPEHTWKDAAVKERVARIAAEAALTTLRADHAAEVARKDAEIADLRGALEDTKAAADDLAQVCLDEHDNKAAGALQFISGFISDRFAALATTETTNA